MPPRSPFPSLGSSADGRASLAQSLIIAAVVIAGLYFAREVLLPLALAILLSFVLTPLLLLLRKIKVPRVLAVAVVVTVAFGIIFALGWLLSKQMTQLATDLPSYQRVLSEKIGTLRQSAGPSSSMEKAADAIKGLEQELAEPAQKGLADPVPSPGVEKKAAPKPVPVEITEAQPRPFKILQVIAGTVLPPLATAGIVILFVIFILMQREDLRDRLIRLIGVSDM
ncbi:MAG: AI-2E family transporter, partial [Methyloceanibacter sp.]